MTVVPANKQFDILLVEDNPGDVRLIREILSDSQYTKQLHVAYDGEQAINCVMGRDKTLGHIVPDLVLLDLNLPKRDGLEVLDVIRGEERFDDMPVIILTSSEALADMQESYRLRANAYITKPVDFNQLNDYIKAIEHYWFSVVNLSS